MVSWKTTAGVCVFSFIPNIRELTETLQRRFFSISAKRPLRGFVRAAGSYATFTSPPRGVCGAAQRGQSSSSQVDLFINSTSYKSDTCGKWISVHGRLHPDGGGVTRWWGCNAVTVFPGSDASNVTPVERIFCGVRQRRKISPCSSDTPDKTHLLLRDLEQAHEASRSKELWRKKK